MAPWDRTDEFRDRFTSTLGSENATRAGKLASSVILLAAVFYLVDVGTVVETVRDVKPIPFLGAVVIAILGIALSAKKWHVLLQSKGEDRGFPETFRIYYVGKFFNLLLPSTIGGDVVRGYSMSKNVGEHVEAFSSIFMDRFTGLVALVLFAVFGFVLNPDLFSWKLSLPVLVLGLGTLMLGFYAFSGPGVRQLRPLIRLLPFGLDTKLGKLQGSIRLYRTKGRYVVFALLLALVFQCISILTRFILAGALGLQIPFVFLFVMVPVTEVILFLPISVQGFGAREALYIFFLFELGIAPEQAVAFSVLVHMLTLASASPGVLGVIRS